MRNIGMMEWLAGVKTREPVEVAWPAPSPPFAGERAGLSSVVLLTKEGGEVVPIFLSFIKCQRA
jgi:hypothetical protein